jgi:hypothetical protein
MCLFFLKLKTALEQNDAVVDQVTTQIAQRFNLGQEQKISTTYLQTTVKKIDPSNLTGSFYEGLGKFELDSLCSLFGTCNVTTSNSTTQKSSTTSEPIIFRVYSIKKQNLFD